MRTAKMTIINKKHKNEIFRVLYVVIKRLGVQQVSIQTQMIEESIEELQGYMIQVAQSYIQKIQQPRVYALHKHVGMSS